MHIYFQLLKIVIIFSDVMSVYEGVSLSIAEQLREYRLLGVGSPFLFEGSEMIHNRCPLVVFFTAFCT